jgi:hypothetical protein
MPVQKGQKDAVHKNELYDWDGFDGQAYFEHNYRSMRRDDAVMLSLASDWFDRNAASGGLNSVDVGSGTNLYPTLSLLRCSRKVTLYEYSRKNVEWLKAAIQHVPESWQAFVNLLESDNAADSADLAARFELIQEQVREKCVAEHGSIFDLPEAQWQIGTMFFVAESLTEDYGEFCGALGCFLGALVPGAPFVAAFMADSTGYDVGEARYPAVSLNQKQLEVAFAGCDRIGRLEICPVKIDPKPIRPGYTGYLVARGTIKG